MTHALLRRKALELRFLGRSYSQIKADLNISKSTLSEWLKAYPLTREQINNLRAFSEIRIEKYRQTMIKKRQDRLDIFQKEEAQKCLPLTDKELFIAGLFLYWGEGNKLIRNAISINNTDPTVVQFALFWMIHSLKVPKNKIKVFIHLYSDMDIKQEIKYWSTLLKMPISSFSKPYIKKSTRSEMDQKGFGHGTCGVRVCDTRLKERFLMANKAIAEYYNMKLE
jgi:hypothetical protein